MRNVQAQHVIGDDGRAYQLVAVPDAAPSQSLIARTGRGVMLVVKVMGWLSIGLITLLVMSVRKK